MEDYLKYGFPYLGVQYVVLKNNKVEAQGVCIDYDYESSRPVILRSMTCEIRRCSMENLRRKSN